MSYSNAVFRFRVSIAIFMLGLALSGVTAFPLLAELRLLVHFLGLDDATAAAGHEGLAFWILTVRFGLEEMYQRHPWIAYGTDWLAFGHLIIALFFVRPFLCPSESRWNLYTGLCACAFVLPLAFICGAVRGIPFYWRLIDCSFGIIGAIPLLYCLRLLPLIEKAQK